MTERPSVNVIADRITRHADAGHLNEMTNLLLAHNWPSIEHFTANAMGTDCFRLAQSLDKWERDNGMGLHEEPKKDGFTHETPIRAFTTWIVDGQYALGKGFRPSLQHLVPYLNAMEGKEGWRLLQVLEAGTQTPSFLFRAERPPVYQVTMGLDTDVSPEFKARIEEFLSQAPTLASQMVMHDGMVDKPHHIRRHLDALRAKVDPVMPEVVEHLDSQPLIDTSALKEGVQSVEETIDLVQFGTGKVLETRPLHNYAYESRMAERRIEPERRDDPVNPKHYNGTHCAEIAENLPGNLAHAITYIWRAGDKPDQPELVELDKALWWMNREMHRAKFRAFDDDDYDENDETVPRDMLLPEQDVFYEHQIHPWKKAKKKLSSITQHPFYLFAAERMEAAGLTGWKSAVVHSMICYTIDHKPAALKSAIAHVNQRRGTIYRIRPLAPGEGIQPIEPLADMGEGFKP
jgi:hypothetical protein